MSVKKKPSNVIFLPFSAIFTFHKPLNHPFFLFFLQEKKNQTAILFCSSFRAHQPLLLSCRFEFISNQKAPDKRPILITLSFAYLHINHCRLCCFFCCSSSSIPPPVNTDQILPPHTLRHTLRLFSELRASHFQHEVDRRKTFHLVLMRDIHELGLQLRGTSVCQHSLCCSKS